MIKLLGALLVVLATSWLGFAKSRALCDRSEQLRHLRSSLSLLETEIGYGTRSLTQACNHIAGGQTSPVALLFQECATSLKKLEGASTYESFQHAVANAWPNMALSTREKAIFLDFSRTLGVSNREDQLHHIALAKENLLVEEEKAREDQKCFAKMYKTLGILSGMLIVILIY